MQELRKLNDEPKSSVFNYTGKPMDASYFVSNSTYGSIGIADVTTPVTNSYSFQKPPEVPAGKKYDAGKPMYALMPVDAEEEVIKVLTAGALKYNEPISEENWRKVDNPMFRYYSAARRHMQADRRGELIDIDKVNPDGSISKGTDCYHLACAIASLMFMLQLKIEEGKK